MKLYKLIKHMNNNSYVCVRSVRSVKDNSLKFSGYIEDLELTKYMFFKFSKLDYRDDCFTIYVED